MAGHYYKKHLVGVWLLSLCACLASQHWVGLGTRVTEWSQSVPADRVRLGVRDEGVYRVTADEIARAAGVSAVDAQTALVMCGFSLTCQGRVVAWTTDGDALLFYGTPVKDIFAPENVYWLTFGSGVPMEVVDATPDAGGTTNTWFMHTEHYRDAFLAPYEPRDRRSSNGTLTNVSNFGEWVPASSDESVRTQQRMLVMPGYDAGTATGVTVQVELASYRDFVPLDSHSCEIWINGISCGTQSWSDEQAVTFNYSVPAGAVTNETVVLSVRNAVETTSSSDFMVLDVRLVYPRRYGASNGSLFCTGGMNPIASADGFETGKLGIWDVTDDGAPVELSAPLLQDTNGYWQAVFECGGERARYVIFDAPGGCFEPSVSGVRNIDWSDSGEMPQLAIVIPPRRWVSGFAEAVFPLADFRNAQGLRTRVIDAEEIYNAFTDGIVHPEAFRRFSVVGATNTAAQTLRYLLFAGHGGSDYKLEVFPLDTVGPYPTLFPLYLVPQVDVSDPGALLLPNDAVLGDVTGGAVPEVAVGRFIATNGVELTHMVNKTIRYELTETWKRKAVFSADWENVGAMYGNFSGIAAATGSGFPAVNWSVESFYPASNQSYLGPLWKNTYNGTGVYYELQEGSGFFYYVGHSSDRVAGNSGLNKLFDAQMLSVGTWPFAPVALLMGCRMGRWTSLDLRTQAQCIAEAGVRNRFSGFTAVISSAGYTATSEAAAFSYAFRDRVAAGALRLGDVWCGAFAALGDEASARLRHFGLLGDPSLCIRVDQTARGTSAAWLIEHGLTNDPYADLKDQDGDGFATWMEYQAGTPYARAGIRFATVSLPASMGIVLAFETVAGQHYRVFSTVDLTAGNWQPCLWRPVGAETWSGALIDGDWPLKSIEVPVETGAQRRFYKVVVE